MKEEIEICKPEEDVEKSESDIIEERKEIVDKIKMSSDSINSTVSENNFTCEICNFKCERTAVLKIHKNKKHKDDEYSYWKTDYLGTGFQTYIDAKADIEDCRELSDDEFEIELEKVKSARKTAWMKTFGNLSSCNM